MSALDEYLNDEKYEPELYDADGWKLLDQARAELAQLRSDLQAAQERNAEQARQLDEARVLIGTINQRVYLKRDIQIEVNHWLAANPAPSSEPPRCTCGMGSATMTELHAKDCTLYRMAAAESQP